MAFFLNASERLALHTKIPFAAGLHNCQQGALLAVCAHFTASDRPAILSMPTGSGKTEVMTGLAFALRARRVLAVEPSIVLRGQTADRFRDMRVFRELRIVPKDLGQPRTLCVEHICAEPEDWKALAEFDVVIATPKTVSPGRDVCEPPDRTLFDLLFFDEAHHTAARTWRAIMHAFPDAKAVLLTATAFRRDRRRLPGQLVYHYPIGKALDDGIYRPVTFHPVPYRVRREESDTALAEAAFRMLESERQAGNDPRVLVRANTVEWADELVPIYRDAGLRTEAIHSARNERQNEASLEALRRGELDAIVCVGMLSEGLDIPSIKIAVLHAPPQSLPQTLQLIGRVSRHPTDQSGPAHLLAIPDKVRGEARRLYREERDWHRFVPQLVDDALRHVYQDRTHALTSHPAGLGILPEDVRPFFSVTLYEWTTSEDDVADGIDLEELSMFKGLPRTVESCYRLPDYRERCTALITRSVREPPWARETGLHETTYDLHVFYAASTDVLVVATTSDVICESIRNRIAPSSKPLAPDRLPAALANVQPEEYVAVGLLNATGLTGTHPKYRVHMGQGSGTSVRPSDGKVFGAGHATGRVSDREIRGIATEGRKAWAMRRDAFGEFLNWCDEVVAMVRGRLVVLPGLGFLAQPRRADELAEEPIAVVLDDVLARSPGAIRVREAEGELAGDVDPFVEHTRLVDGVLECRLTWNSRADPIELTCCPTREPVWEQTDSRTARVIIERSDTRVDDLSLSSYLCQTPPKLVMPAAGIISGSTQWTRGERAGALPEGCLRRMNWDDCDITKEARPGDQGRPNVQDATLALLEDQGSFGMIAVKDDAAYEVADFVVLEPRRDPKLVSFVHCKWSASRDPGCRLADIKELLNQGCRSHLWVRHQGLVSRLCDAIDTRQNSRVVQGNRDDLYSLRDTYRRNEWDFRVILVQPGMSTAQLRGQRGKRALTSILAVYEWLASAGAELQFWGS